VIDVKALPFFSYWKKKKKKKKKKKNENMTIWWGRAMQAHDHCSTPHWQTGGSSCWVLQYPTLADRGQRLPRASSKQRPKALVDLCVRLDA